MSDLTLRNVKGSPLTNQEVDDNFSNLNADKYQSGDSASFSDVTLTGMSGSMTWNTDDGALDIPLNSDVTLQVGQEQVLLCKAGEALSNGDVVYASGAVGNSGAIEVSKYIANNTIEELYVLGVATQAIASGEFGYITIFGKVRGLSTDGSSVGETWIDGTILYASPTTAGALTSVQPAPPNQDISVAMVVSAHASNGTLVCRPTAGFHIGELHDVNAPSPASGDVLAWNSAGYWENASNYITTTGYNNTNWDTAYGWGDHASAGYLLSSSYTASDVLTKIKTVDGSGSGLDADSLDGYQYTAFNSSVLSYRTGGSATRYKIRLPFATNSSKMLKFTISMYQSYAQHDYEVSGYLYPSTNQWYLPHVVYKGTGTPDIVVGRDGDGRAYVSVAGGSYTGVRVHSVVIGYTGSTADSYNQDWSIASDTDVSNSVTPAITRLWSSNNDGSGSGLDADLLDGQHGSYYAPASSLSGYVSKTGDTMTGDLVTTSGDSNGIFIGTGGANITSVSPTSKDIVVQDCGQFRMGGASWDWNAWAGWAWAGGTNPIYFGGPASSAFTSNASPPTPPLLLSGVSYTQSDGSMRAPIFYDSGNTGYYVDPASVSRLSSFNVGGSDAYIYESATSAISIRTGSSGYKYFTFDAAGSFYALNGDIRAPIYYDYNDTGYYVDPAGPSRIGKLTLTGNIAQSETHRPDAVWGAAGNTTGAVIIELPGTSSQYDMLNIHIDVYEYNGTAGSQIVVSGHNWTSGWYKASVTVIGGFSKPIYLARTGTKYCIQLGDVGSSWAYGSVHVTKATTATYYNVIDWTTAWGISQTTTEPSYLQKSTNYNAFGAATLRTSGSVRAPIFYDSDNTSYYWDPNYSSAHRFNTASGYLIAGPQNTSYCHFSTDRGSFYFNKTVTFDGGGIRMYDTAADVRSYIFYDQDNTAYYTNPASTSVLNSIYLEGALYHNGDADTYFQFHAADQARIVTGGAERFEVNNTQVTVQNKLVVVGNAAYNPSGGSISTSTNEGSVNYVYANAGGTPTRGDCAIHVYHQWSANLSLTLTDGSWVRGDMVVVKNTQGTNVTVTATRIYLPNGSYDTSVTFNGVVGSFTLIKYTTTTGYWMVGP